MNKRAPRSELAPSLADKNVTCYNPPDGSNRLYPHYLAHVAAEVLVRMMFYLSPPPSHSRCRTCSRPQLFQLGARVNARDHTGATALHIAVSHNQPAAVTALLAAGADLEMQNSIGWTALHIATQMLDGPTVAERLIQAGANVHSQDKKGWANYERLWRLHRQESGLSVGRRVGGDS